MLEVEPSKPVERTRSGAGGRPPRPTGWSLSALLVGFVLGCTSDLQDVPLPPDLTSSSMLVLHSADQPVWRARVLGEDWRRTNFEAGLGAYLVAFHGDIELPSDRWLGRADLETGGCALVTPASVYALRDAERFEPVGTVPAEVLSFVSSFARRRCRRCVDFEAHPIPLTRSDETGTLEVSAQVFVRPGLALALTELGAVVLDESGELGWLAGCDRIYKSVARVRGRVFATDGLCMDEIELDVDARTCRVLTSTNSPYGSIRNLVGAREADAVEVFGIAGGPRVIGFRYDGVGFEKLLEFEQVAELRNGRVGLTHDPIEGVVFSGGGDYVYAKRAGEYRPMLVKGEGYVFPGLTSVEGFGVLVLVGNHQSTEVRLLEPGTSRFATLAPDHRDELRDLVGFRGGLLGLGTGGLVNEYHQDLGLCPKLETSLLTGSDGPERISGDEDENFLFSFRGAKDALRGAIHWMTPRPALLPDETTFP